MLRSLYYLVVVTLATVNLANAKSKMSQECISTINSAFSGVRISGDTKAAPFMDTMGIIRLDSRRVTTTLTKNATENIEVYKFIDREPIQDFSSISNRENTKGLLLDRKNKEVTIHRDTQGQIVRVESRFISDAAPENKAKLNSEGKKEKVDKRNATVHEFSNKDDICVLEKTSIPKKESENAVLYSVSYDKEFCERIISKLNQPFNDPDTKLVKINNIVNEEIQKRNAELIDLGQELRLGDISGGSNQRKIDSFRSFGAIQLCSAHIKKEEGSAHNLKTRNQGVTPSSGNSVK